MLIAIDHGNKQIKTAHKTYVSGIISSDTKPPFGENIIYYKNKYYTLSDKRLPYMRDKTENDNFLILSLFGIAYEIEALNCYSDDEIIDIQLAVGLPPAHFGSQYKKFETYFKNRGTIEFEAFGKPYSICITDAVAFPQAYAAAIPILMKVRDLSKVTVIDIGGFTADFLQLKKGEFSLETCDSLENGVILLYNDIIKKVNGDFDILMEESDIDSIIRGENTDYPSIIVETIKNMAQKYIDQLVGKLRERMIDLRIGKSVWVGGGSILLKRFIKECDKVENCCFVDEINANVRGYEILYSSEKRR